MQESKLAKILLVTGHILLWGGLMAYHFINKEIEESIVLIALGVACIYSVTK